MTSGGASAAKEPGHFEVRTSSSQVTRMHFFPQNVDDFFSRRPQKTKATPLRLFYCQNKTKQSAADVVKFLFSVHTITEAKQSNRQGGSQGGGSSSQVI